MASIQYKQFSKKPNCVREMVKTSSTMNYGDLTYRFAIHPRKWCKCDVELRSICVWTAIHHAHNAL